MISSHYLLLLYTTDIKTTLQSQIGENNRKGCPRLSESQLLLVIAGNIHLHEIPVPSGSGRVAITQPQTAVISRAAWSYLSAGSSTVVRHTGRCGELSNS